MNHLPKTSRRVSAAAARSARLAGRVWGIRPRLVVDIILAVSFLALMSVNLTGLLIHEWWGIALMLLVIVHLLSQWDWTIASSRSFVLRLTQRARLTYLLNWALFVAGVMVFFSGLVISENALPSFGLSLGSGGTPIFGFWHRLPTLSADAVLLLAGIHLGLNWRWVVNAFKQVLRIGTRGARTQRTMGAEV